MVRSKPTPLSVDRTLEREGLTEVMLLAKAVEFSQGRGNLIVLVVNEPYLRDIIVDIINKRYKTKKVIVTKREQISRKSIEEESDVYFWQLPETVGPDLLNALNFRRGLFYETDFPHVVICNEGVLDAIIRDAPGFWRYKGSFYIIKGKPVQTLFDLFLFGHEKWEKNVAREMEINEYLLKKVKSDGQRAYLFFERAQLYLRLYEYEKAHKYYKKSLAIFEGLGNLYETAMAYRQIGTIYQVQGEYEKALEYYEKSLFTFEKIQDVKGVAKVYYNRGVVHQVQGEYEKAQEYYKKSLLRFEKIQDVQGVAATYLNMGVIYQVKGAYEKAQEYFRKSLFTFEKIQDVQGVAKVYHNRGVIHQVKGEYEKAQEYYKKSLEIKKKIQDKEGIAVTYHNIGVINEVKGAYEKALEYYKKSLEIKKKIHDIKGIAATDYQIRMVHEDKKRILKR